MAVDIGGDEVGHHPTNTFDVFVAKDHRSIPGRQKALNPGAYGCKLEVRDWVAV